MCTRVVDGSASGSVVVGAAVDVVVSVDVVVVVVVVVAGSVVVSVVVVAASVVFHFFRLKNINHLKYKGSTNLSSGLVPSVVWPLTERRLRTKVAIFISIFLKE